jgi:hypothetical protein
MERGRRNKGAEVKVGTICSTFHALIIVSIME